MGMGKFGHDRGDGNLPQREFRLKAGVTGMAPQVHKALGGLLTLWHMHTCHSLP